MFFGLASALTDQMVSQSSVGRSKNYRSIPFPEILKFSAFHLALGLAVAKQKQFKFLKITTVS